MGSSPGSASGPSIWRFAEAELDEAARELRVAGELVDVEPRAFDVLLMLLRRAGEVIANEDIITEVWSARVINDTAYANVSNSVGKLRKVLKDERRDIIKTVQRVGYRLAAPVERVPRGGAPATVPLEVDRPVPGRPHWRLSEPLDSGGYGEVWVATHAKTREQRVFKFCMDAVRLSALKRESTLFRMLKETLGERAPVPTLLEWQFETPPYYLESERWGLDLRAWADSMGGLTRLSLETRLQLMVRTAEVVAAIHAVGVLHKDLKPQNILVRGDASNFEVRLCDFGAGTILDDSALRDLNITRQGFTHTVANAGTPMYLAPEIQLGGLPSIQSDVYSLGVMLYQLAVSDWRPVVFGWESDVGDELLREDIAACIDRDPAVRPPSASIVAQRLASLAERREQLEQARLAEARNRNIAESLERARARRPWAIAAAGTLVVAAVISLVLSLLARRAAERAAENERVARAVADFLVNDIVRQSSPDYGGHVDVTLKAAMLRSAPKISERLSGPVAAELNHSVAEILASLSAPSEAANLARSSADIYTQLYGKADRRTLTAKMDELGYRLLLEPGHALIAELDAMTPELSKLPDTDPVSVKAAMVRAWLRTYVEDRVEDALPAFADIISKLEGSSSKEFDLARLMYIRHLMLAGRYGQMRAETDRLLPRFEARYGANSRYTLELHRLLGRAFEAERASTHDYAAAERQYQIVIQGMSALYGPDSSEADQVRIDLGDLMINTERWTEAVDLERGLLDRFDARLGSDSFYTWRTRLSLLEALNGLAAADPQYIRVAVTESSEYLALAKATKPIDHHYCRLLLTSAHTLILANRNTDAAVNLDEVDALVKHQPYDLERRYYEGLSNYERGLLSAGTGNPGAAAKHFSNALDQLQTVFGEDHPLLQDIRTRLAGFRHGESRTNDADPPPKVAPS